MSTIKKSMVPTLFLWAGLTSAWLLLVFLAAHWDYYSLPEGARPLHPRHEALRPSGRCGLSFGIVGTVFMLLNLSYLLRKHCGRFFAFGTLRSWMSFHVFTGLMAPGLVLLHSAFVPHSALGALSFWAMVVVVLAGVLGRFVYSQVPRSLEGRELELEELRQRLSAYRSRLEALGVGPGFLEKPESSPPQRRHRGILGTLADMMAASQRIKRDYRELRRAVRASPQLRPLARRVLPLAKRLYWERQCLDLYGDVRHLMGTWRFLHRWLALAMLLVVAFHIAVGFIYGELWVVAGGP